MDCVWSLKPATSFTCPSAFGMPSLPIEVNGWRVWEGRVPPTGTC